MATNKVAALGIILLSGQLALADASFQASTQITGGALVDQLKSNPLTAHMTRNMFAPTNTLTLVHGNQKAVVTKDSTEIIDLDRETITRTDTEKKTYSVVTFQQMRQAIQNAPKQMQQAQQQIKQAQQQQQQMPPSDLKTTFDVSVKNTGATRVVNGLDAQEQVIIMTMKVTDPNATGAGSDASPNATPSPVTALTYTITTDVWIAPDPPEIKEIEDFDLRMAKKMMEGVDMSAFITSLKANNSMNMSPLFGSQPGAAEAFAQMGKEMAKLKGTHVMEVTSMGGTGTGPGVGANAAAGPAPSGQSMAGQVASDTATQTAAGEANKLGVFGSALGNSAISAFHRKKAAPPAAPAAPATGTAATGGTQGATLMEMTTQKANFSQETVPASAFVVPPNFKQVASPYEQMKQ